MRNKRLRAASLVVILLLVALPATAAVDLFTAAGTASAPTTSSCGTLPPGSPWCASGWFRVAGAKTVVVKINATAGTNTVVLEHRMNPTDTKVSTLYTWTDAGAATVGRVVDPPSGELRVRVTAIGGGGTVVGKLEATSTTGGMLW